MYLASWYFGFSEDRESRRLAPAIGSVISKGGPTKPQRTLFLNPFDVLSFNTERLASAKNPETFPLEVFLFFFEILSNKKKAKKESLRSPGIEPGAHRT